MRVKFTNHIGSIEEMKAEFCAMLDSLPYDLSECTFSGVNFYFNIFDKSTGERIGLLNDDGEPITALTYGNMKMERKRMRRGQKTANVIDFNRNRLKENV